MKFIKKAILLFSFVLFVAAPVFSLVTPVDSFAAVSDAKQCEKSFLGIQPWFRGLAVVEGGKCAIAAPGSDLNGKTLDLTGFIWRIALNVIDIALAAVGYIAFFFVLYGGFQFLTGGNNPSQVEKARKTILNAVVGLVISFGAVAIINLVFGIIG
ncbi:MAG TPA: hypothetical protein VIM31_03420 [Candidatus Microsaccharimonas sp.]|jgi:hypothetical protein